MTGKLGCLFVFSILFFMIIGVVCANDANSTDFIQSSDEDMPISIDNSSHEISSCDEDALSHENSLSGDDSLGDSQDGGGADANESSKLHFKIDTYSNFVKKGNTYCMYLTDENGHGIVNKKVNINFNGNNYQRTTTTYGRFDFKIDSNSPSVSLTVSCDGDDKFEAFTQTINVMVDKSFSMSIGNTKLLTNGYLRVYPDGPANMIANKLITVTVGGKVFSVRTTSEGFVVIKPDVAPNSYEVSVQYGKYVISKKIQCIAGNPKNPLKQKVPTVNGVPDVDWMTANFVMANNNAKYTLKKVQYREVLKRDSYCLYLYGKLSKYTFFKTKSCPKIYHIIKREKWNVIERALNKKLVKRNKYSYWPAQITVSLKGKSYTYSEVRDIQNKGYTCGPTSASVCSQVLRNFHSEKFFQKKGHVVNGINIPVLKKILNRNHFTSKYFYSLNGAVKQLKKGAALIAFLPNHYVAVIDISRDGKKVLVSNSYGSYNKGSKGIPTNWVSLKHFKSKYAGIGLIVKCKYKLSKNTKKQTKNFYSSMGPNWKRQNVNERIPNVGL